MYLPKWQASMPTVTIKVTSTATTSCPNALVASESMPWARTAQEDLPYIVSDVLKHGMAEERVSLKSYIVNLAYGLKPMATLKIEINGKEYEESSSGDGQYDAFVRALRKIYKVTLGRKFPMLTNYAVTIPPGGRTDAFVQTVITWSFEDTIFRTRGLDADQTEAAIKATVKMLNIIEDEYES